MSSQKAKRAAQNILRETNYTIPVDIRRIIKHYGIEIIEQPMEDNVSGMMVVKDKRAMIGVNQAHHPNRQRFSLAHELGHYVLHRETQSVFVDSSTIFFRDERAADGTDRFEIEANTFAAELLMPEPDLRTAVRKPLDAFDERAVSKLAVYFEVSVQALTIRLTRLKLISA